jgi:hypothetical protein
MSESFDFLNKTISSVSGNNVTFSGFEPTETYILDTDLTDGTAGMMQLASGISTISFMCYIPTGTNVSNKVLKIGSLQLSINSSTGQMSSVSGAKRYVNGELLALAKLDQWQMISLVFNSPIVINADNPIEIILGSEAGIANEIYIDQLMIFDKKLTENNLLSNLYNLLVGEIPSDYKVISDSKFRIRDTNALTLEDFDVIEIDYSIDSNVPTLYSFLNAGASVVNNYTVSYKVSSGTATFQKTTIDQSDALNTLFISNSQYILPAVGPALGSKLVSINGIPSNYTVSSIENFEDYSKITLATNMPSKVDANKQLIFEDLNHNNNSTNNAKLKIGTKYIEQGDLILVNTPTAKYIYEVTTLDPDSIFLYNMTDITYTATFTRVSGEVGYKYSYGNIYYEFINGAIREYIVPALSLPNKVNSKIQPQYLPTEQ